MMSFRKKGPKIPPEKNPWRKILYCLFLTSFFNISFFDDSMSLQEIPGHLGYHISAQGLPLLNVFVELGRMG